MNRKELEKKIENKEYEPDYSPCKLELMPDNTIIDKSRDKLWNRNAVEEHNDEVRALKAIFQGSANEKIKLFKEDVICCLSEEVFDNLPKSLESSDIKFIADILIETFENVINEVNVNIYSNFDDYITNLYLKFTESFKKTKKYIILIVNKMCK